MENNLTQKSESLLKAAWLIAVVIIVSKFAGFLRDIVVANFYGASLVSDAYYYAYQLPSLALILLGGVGGPFHSAVVSVFSKIMPANATTADENQNKLFNTFLTGSFLSFAIIGILVFMFADVIMQLIISNGSAELISLAALHLKIMSPIFVIGGVIGIYYGLLVCYKKFLIPNISPSLLSIAIVLILIFTKEDKSGITLAIATTIGAICQFLFQLPKIRQLGFKLKPNFDFTNNPQFKSILELLFPAILSSTIGQIHLYVDMFFASSLREGAWTSIGYANRIFQFPVGILVTAFMVPLFPLFSRLVAEKDFDGVKTYFNKGVGMLNFVGFPIIIAIVLLGYDAVKLVFERGAFDSEATYMVTIALLFLSVSLLPYIFRDSITRVFYAFDDSKTPFYVALSAIFMKFILNYFMVPVLGIGGITLSTSLVTLWNAVLLGVLIRKKMHFGLRKYFIDLIKMFIIALVSYGICFVIYQGIAKTNLPLIIDLAIMLIIIGFVYFAVSFVCKIEYAKELVNRVLSKWKK